MRVCVCVCDTVVRRSSTHVQVLYCLESSKKIATTLCLERQICRFLLGPSHVVVAISGILILTGSKTRGPELSPHCYIAKVETIISGAKYSGDPRKVCVLPPP